VKISIFAKSSIFNFCVHAYSCLFQVEVESIYTTADHDKHHDFFAFIFSIFFNFLCIYFSSKLQAFTQQQTTTSTTNFSTATSPFLSSSWLTLCLLSPLKTYFVKTLKTYFVKTSWLTLCLLSSLPPFVLGNCNQVATATKLQLINCTVAFPLVIMVRLSAPSPPFLPAAVFFPVFFSRPPPPPSFSTFPSHARCAILKTLTGQHAALVQDVLHGTFAFEENPGIVSS